MNAEATKPEVLNRLAEFFNNPEQAVDPESHKSHAGRFKNGNRGGPGNPFARRVAKLRQAMLEECAEEDLRELTRAMLNKAKQGDVAAARLICQYSLGKPAKTADPDRVDEDELSVLKGMACPPATVELMVNALPADTFNSLMQGMWPGFVLAYMQKLKATMAEQDRLQKEYEEEVAIYEALPAEERLAMWKQAGGTPPPELVEEVECERAARQQTAASAAPAPSAAPSPNGGIPNDRNIIVSDSAAKEAPAAAKPSSNGISSKSSGTQDVLNKLDQLVSTPANALPPKK
ncbi:MAG: hypothetical protein U0744_09970 [Gemmataceae bacterium]